MASRLTSGVVAHDLLFKLSCKGAEKIVVLSGCCREEEAAKTRKGFGLAEWLFIRNQAGDSSHARGHALSNYLGSRT